MLTITDDSYLQDSRYGRTYCLRPCGSDLVYAGVGPGSRVNEPGDGMFSAAQTLAILILSACVLALASLNGSATFVDAVARFFPATSYQAPQPPPQGIRSAVSLATGTEIKGRLRIDGYGELNIKNGTSYDAIVNLVEPRTMQAVRSVYVQAGRNFVEKNIAPGTYEIYFSTGIDWDSTARSFVKDASYGRLERQISYYEAPDLATGQTKYCGFEITLQATEGGDVASLPVDKQTFQQMMDQPTDTAQVKPVSPHSNPSSSN